jgi:hypothetical protein
VSTLSSWNLKHGQVGINLLVGVMQFEEMKGLINLQRVPLLQNEYLKQRKEKACFQNTLYLNIG